MGTTTAISWTTSTWGPIYGCTKISPGCKKCYAIEVIEGLARKFKTSNPKAYAFYGDLTKDGNWTGKVKVHPEKMDQPLRWTVGRKIFVNSLTDMFHESLVPADIANVFAVMAVAHWHTFQVLTKRADIMRDMLNDPHFRHMVELGASMINANDKYKNHPQLGKKHPGIVWPLKNVWLGVSVESQKEADIRIPLLLETPAAVKFLSCEPLLAPIDFKLVPGFNKVGLSLDNFWVIVGGESGKDFRPMELEWAISLQKQCAIAKVPFFFKQQAALRSGQNPWLPDEEGRKWSWHQFPGELTPAIEVTGLKAVRFEL